MSNLVSTPFLKVERIRKFNELFQLQFSCFENQITQRRVFNYCVSNTIQQNKKKR